MPSNHDTIELVYQARDGDTESMDHLASVASERLSDYVYRLTLDHHVAQDILQETMLEMVRSLGKLRKAESFWSWIYRTALGKAQHYFRDKSKHQRAQLSALEKQHILKKNADQYGEGLNGLIQKELAQAIFEGMQRLNLRQRTILALRCFEEMSYAQIAEVMNLSSELQARVQFFRAKKALEKQLVHHGFNKKILLTALGLFALISSRTKIASASTAVNASVLEAGGIAAFIGTAFTKMNMFIAAIAAAAAVNVTYKSAIIAGVLIVFFGFLFALFAFSFAARR